MKRFLVVASVFLSCLSPAFSWDEESVLEKQHFSIAALNLGQNTIQKGFPGYPATQYIGVDLYVPGGVTSSHWWSRFSWRGSFEYFPLVLPDGVYGITEDLMGLTASQVFFFPVGHAGRSSISAGIGLGAYADWIRMDTPATGQRSNISYYPGGTFSLGWGFKISDDLEIIPEARTHFIYVAKDYFTMNTSMHIGVAWWFSRT